MSDLPLPELLHVAKEAAKAGAAILTKHWCRLSGFETKSHAGDLVTEADRESERVIFDLLGDHYPDHAVLGEESGLQSGMNEEYLWAVDPLDGTTNYTHGFPLCAVSIGLLQRGVPIVGVVYNPFHQELFEAARGLGAKLNGEVITVSKEESLAKSLLVSECLYDRLGEHILSGGTFSRISSLSHGVRKSGSAALDLAYVACGRFEGYWDQRLKVWDMVAGVVIVEEAGGRVSSYQGDEPLDLDSGVLLATNRKIHQELSKRLMESIDE